VVATGGKSIPKMGATGWAYDAPGSSACAVTETRPALVPLTFEIGLLETLKPLSGVAVDAVVTGGKTKFAEAMLFTHRGLSRPRHPADLVLLARGRGDRRRHGAGRTSSPAQGRQGLQSAPGGPYGAGRLILPARLAQKLADDRGARGNLADTSDKVLRADDGRERLAGQAGRVGGLPHRRGHPRRRRHRDLNSTTMAANDVPGLYFIGEASTSPAGSAATISSGPGRRLGGGAGGLTEGDMYRRYVSPESLGRQAIGDTYLRYMSPTSAASAPRP
jgi:hypothetical protein